MSVGASAMAQEAAGSGSERSGTLAQDVKQYVTAPLRAQRPQWARFGAVVGAVALAYQLDDDVRDSFDTVLAAPGAKPDLRDAEDAVLPALAVGGTWLAAAVLEDDDRRREAHTMLKAGLFSGVASYTLKQISGRRRPYETFERDEFGDDGEAFPSTHTAVAFAIGTVLAESGDPRRRWVRRALGYGIGVATAYRRMDHDAHWLSDTVAGAGLGIATARFLLKRSTAASARLTLAPVPGGVGVAYTVDLRQ
jgi:hypothetical protein